MDRTAARLHRREEIDRRPAPAMMIHLIDTRIDHYEQVALCGQMVKRSGCVEVAPVDNPRVTVCPACQAVREAATTAEAPAADVPPAPAPASAAPTADWLAQALDATHTYGAPEAVCAYRDRDGGAWHSTPTAQTVEVRTRTRRQVTTVYPDGHTAQGWETLAETTTPYTSRHNDELDTHTQ